MTREQLIEQYLRLKRKLATSTGAWHSGRVDRLAAALQAVERELSARRLEWAATGHAPLRHGAAADHW